MITRQEVLNWLAQEEVATFKERDTDFLYEATLLGDSILVRKMPPYRHEVERLTIDEFIKRFEESFV